MQVHCRVTSSMKLGGGRLYPWVERGTVRVKCLAQEHNTMSLARGRSIAKQSNIEGTKPLEVLRQPLCYCRHITHFPIAPSFS